MHQIIREEDFLLNILIRSWNNKVPTPYLQRKDCIEQMKALAVEFGLTPSAKSENCSFQIVNQGPKQM